MYINATLVFNLTDTVAPKVSGGRNVKAFQVEAGPVSVTRHNRAEGRQEVTRIVQAWLDKWQHPTVLRFKCHSATLYPFPTEKADRVGTYEVYTGIDGNGNFYSHMAHDSFASWDAAKRSAYYRMVDTWVDWHDDDQMREACRFLDGHDRSGEMSKQLRRYAGFQRAHKAARDADHTDPHTFACENEGKYTPAAA